VVAFEGGWFDDHNNRGWTVHVRGIAATARASNHDGDIAALVTITRDLFDAYTYQLLSD